ncbi:putative PHD type zinc finger protein with BAH domain-containing protein [Massospora cicadina]|nr:putative PHD type zinc finger protein with BAH domain-containing protein [Massospora cicadina]
MQPLFAFAKRPLDFVYFDSDRPDRVYQIGRVMGLTRQYGTAPPTLEVEVYYRAADINATFSLGTHPRQVYGSFERQKIALGTVVGKCTVLHRSQIDRLAAYLQLADCFYYEQVFYQSLARFYTAIPAAKALHRPSPTLKALKRQCEYLLCEPEVADALLSASREASPTSTGEATSPVAEIETSSAPDAEGDGETDMGDDDDSGDDAGPGEPICNRAKPICSFLFPYRYYSPGRETSYKEPTDAEGLLPPAEIAVGADFQIELPNYTGPRSSDGARGDGEGNFGVETLKLQVLIALNPDQCERAIEILEALAGMEFAIPTYFSEFQSRALQEIVQRGFDLENVVAALREADFGTTLWSEVELTTLEGLLLAEGLKLHKIAKKFTGRTRVEVVRQFYRWKGDRQRLYAERREEFERLEEGLKAIALDNSEHGLAAHSEPKAQTGPKLPRIAPNGAESCHNCGVRVTASWGLIPSCPHGEDLVYCGTCANHWYRYAAHLTPAPETYKRALSESRSDPGLPPYKLPRKGGPTDEPASPPIKLEPGSDLKQPKVALPIGTSSPRRFFKHRSAEPSYNSPRPGANPSGSSLSVASQGRVSSLITQEIKREPVPLSQDSPKPEPTTDSLMAAPCQVCDGLKRSDDKAVCTRCGLVVHYDCFFLDCLPVGWTCDWCTNLESKSHINNATCVICHVPSARSAHCIRPTSKFNFVHALCTLLMPSLVIKLGVVDGVPDLDLASWKERCKVCAEARGFKVACRHCPTHFVHASCARSDNGYRIGFDDRQAPVIVCPAHPNLPSPKPLDGVDGDTRKSFIRLHLESRAPAPLKGPVCKPRPTTGAPRPPLVPRLTLVCSVCGVDSSPLWWWPGPRGSSGGQLAPYLPSLDARFSASPSDFIPPSTLQCHRCRWDRGQPPPPRQPAGRRRDTSDMAAFSFNRRFVLAWFRSLLPSVTPSLVDLTGFEYSKAGTLAYAPKVGRYRHSAGTSV